MSDLHPFRPKAMLAFMNVMKNAVFNFTDPLYGRKALRIKQNFGFP